MHKLYNIIRNKLPESAKAKLSKFVIRILDKPYYDDSNNLNLNKAIITISCDFELAWGWCHAKNGNDFLSISNRERENVPIILNKLNDLEIPITWATVGHLFLDSCKRINNKPHYNMPRPKYFENEFWRFKKGDWYDFDPCGNYKSNPEFYAPDLVEMILNSKTNHEIGSHSFSHCDFSENNSYPELIESELMESQLAFSRFGIKPASFVFPGNFAGNLMLLKKYGYNIIRHKTNHKKEIGYPELLHHGLLAIHDSLYINSSYEKWSFDELLGKAKKYIQKSINTKSICHFWFHPSLEKDYIELYLFPLLEYIKSNEDNMYVFTMADIYNRYYIGK